MGLDHIVKAASILSYPDLEDDTKQRINRYIRDEIDRVTPRQSSEQQPTSLDPFRAAVEKQYGTGMVDEWINGAKEGDQT